MISSRRICQSVTTNSSTSTSKIPKWVPIKAHQGITKATLITTTTTMMNWTIWCLIWQRPIKGKRIRRRARVVLHRLQLLVLYTGMRTGKLKMRGSRKKSSWERNLKKLPWISWKVELLNKTELQELASHRKDNNSRETLITIATWIQTILNQMLMLIPEQQLPSTQVKSNSIPNKSKKPSKWPMARWSNSEKIDYILVTEIGSTCFKHSWRRSEFMMISRFINLSLVSHIMVYHQIGLTILKEGMMERE